MCVRAKCLLYTIGPCIHGNVCLCLCGMQVLRQSLSDKWTGQLNFPGGSRFTLRFPNSSKIDISLPTTSSSKVIHVVHGDNSNSYILYRAIPSGGARGAVAPPPKNRAILAHARFTRCKMAKRIKLGCSQTPLTSFFPR